MNNFILRSTADQKRPSWTEMMFVWWRACSCYTDFLFSFPSSFTREMGHHGQARICFTCVDQQTHWRRRTFPSTNKQYARAVWHFRHLRGSRTKRRTRSWRPCLRFWGLGWWACRGPTALPSLQPSSHSPSSQLSAAESAELRCQRRGCYF